MAELDISRATVFREYAKIKKVTEAVYDKSTSTDVVIKSITFFAQSQVSLM